MRQVLRKNGFLQAPFPIFRKSSVVFGRKLEGVLSMQRNAVRAEHLLRLIFTKSSRARYPGTLALGVSRTDGSTDGLVALVNRGERAFFFGCRALQHLFLTQNGLVVGTVSYRFNHAAGGTLVGPGHEVA